MSDMAHDEFCFNTDLYQDDVEGYMCICNRLGDARHQAVEDAVNAPGLHPSISALIREAEQRVKSKRLVDAIFHAPDSGARAFVLQRTTDVSGVSGTGTVAHGVEFPDGCVALRWVGGNPTSVVFHDNGIASVEAIHGHGGNTRIVWTSEDMGERAAEMDECQQRGYAAALDRAREAVAALDAYYAIEECQGNPLEKGDPEDPDPWQQGHLIQRDDALAAIDALAKGEQA